MQTYIHLRNVSRQNPRSDWLIGFAYETGCSPSTCHCIGCSAKCSPCEMQLTGQNDGGTATSTFLLVRKGN